jgi:hypothetical protein
MNKNTLYILGGLAIAYLLYYNYSKPKGTKTNGTDKSSSTSSPSSYKNEDEKFKAVLAEVEKQAPKNKQEAEAIMKKMGVTMAEFDAWMKKSMETALQGLSQNVTPSKTKSGSEEARFAFNGY